jgi:GNAT superfamily N-acetyltransferase
VASAPSNPVTVEQLEMGPTVSIRQMQPDDADALVRFHTRLSDETTYRRYFTVHRTLRPDELDRFTHVDHANREAIVALDEAGEIVGVGRYDREPGASEADGAFVVEDAWQGLGLGPVLLRHIIDGARRLGVQTLTAETLAINRPMLVVFRRAGYPMTTASSDGTVRVSLDLREGPGHG